jgi:hypothetical protein
VFQQDGKWVVAVAFETEFHARKFAEMAIDDGIKFSNGDIIHPGVVEPDVEIVRTITNSVSNVAPGADVFQVGVCDSINISGRRVQ